jgi:GntR family phosphonate transport system transcriptional regulator
MQVGTIVDVEAPLWRRIELTLLAEINQGVWGVGSQMPSEFVLAERFGVNRHTVRRAMAALVQRGAIRIEKGRGSFVQDLRIHYEVGSRTRVDENLKKLHRGHSGTLLAEFGMPASPEIAKRLELKVGTPLIVLDTLNESDSIPISLVRTYLPADRFENFARAYNESGHSMTVAFERCGVTNFSRKLTDITARMPEKTEAMRLKMPENIPVVISETVDIDADRKPIKYGIAVFPSDRVYISFAH